MNHVYELFEFSDFGALVGGAFRDLPRNGKSDAKGDALAEKSTGSRSV